MSQTNPSGLSGADEPVQEALAPQNATDIPLDQRAKDPVCGATVDIRTTQFTSNYLVNGGAMKTFYFDSDECKQLFERDPEKYSEAL